MQGLRLYLSHFPPNGTGQNTQPDSVYICPVFPWTEIAAVSVSIVKKNRGKKDALVTNSLLNAMHSENLYIYMHCAAGVCMSSRVL